MATLKHPPFPADAPHLAIVQKRLTLQVDQAPPGPPGPQGNPGPAGPQGVPGPGVINYSAAEQNTGTTWVDGRNIYQKTINTGQLPNGTAVTVAHSVPNIANVLRVWGWASDAGTPAIFLPLPYVDSASLAQHISVWVDRTNVHLSATRPTFSVSYVSFQYTCTDR